MATDPSGAQPASVPARPHTPPTLAQVAERAGVSLKTASRAVNGEPRVAEATRERVLDAAHQLGFQLNRAASLLARGLTSNLVGLITGDLANPFYSAVAKGVEQELRSHGMQLTVASSDEEPSRERGLIGEFVDRQVRALILVSTISDHSDLAGVQSRGIPVVFVDRPGVGIDADSVLLDNRRGAADAVGHLVAAGHTAIGFVGDLSRLETHRERLAGFQDAMRAASLDPDRWVRHDAHDVGAALAEVRGLLTGADRPTALFTSNNRITIGAVRAMIELDAWPALVGFDDFELADVLGVTVIAHDPVEMGRTAARLAFGAMERRHEGPSRVVLPTRLVQRGSGERPPGT
ncbi:LacI family DNA-binding transcriptional regulator [Leifsonia sp. LS1]|uniref:LacI family DNA-binding transcriptional regulator n=1 Tax=Leifsonia sp. LS1 TaxID=2828483 RepID=UPI001CFF2C6F|nr:LacI family DNA-binding transcriptional regulator [Leifsonia sp. LS1]